ncbi:MAG: hypothetical protein AAFP82_15000 [Bacteroidota bacterium]
MKLDSNTPIYIAFFCVLIFSSTDLIAQQQEWEIDKLEKREQAKKQALDSSLVHLKKKWEIRAAYGRWFFPQTGIDEFANFPNRMDAWQIAGTWHFKEMWLAELSVGLQWKRDVPKPNIAAILSGVDFDIEGSGGAIVPLSLGLKYYFTQKRFRPLAGISSGVARMVFQYTVVEGNIRTGIERTDNQFSDGTLFGSINAGFDYRLSKRFSWSANVAHYFSKSLSIPIGGYSNYQGIMISTGIGIIF